MTRKEAATKLKTGDRVRVPDGREGKLCWIIPSGEEAAVALDGVYGTFHIHPRELVRVTKKDSGESFLAHLAVDGFPERVLERMESDGWTPTQVRELIASYRLLARDVAELREQTGIVGHGFVSRANLRGRWLRQCFYVVEKELRKLGIQEIDIHYDLPASMPDTLSMVGPAGQTTQGTLFEAFDAHQKRKGKR